MTIKPRYAALLAFAVVMLFSLACTLGGGASGEATGTPAAFVTSSPTGTPPIGATTPSPSNTPAISPTHTPSPTATPIVGSGPGGCVLKGTYLADVTIPDGTVLAPGASFVKTWSVRNDGTCNWEAGYQLVFAEGNQMGGPAAANIAAAAPGEKKDISVNLIAPAAAGDYTGKWRLRASNGAIFGGYTVVIKVAGTPTPTPTATPIPTPLGGGIWGSVWETSCGTSNCGQMNLIQTGSRVVGTYASGEGSIDGTITGNLVSGTWRRGTASGTFDFWMDAGNQRWHGNWNKTQAWCGHRPGVPDLSPCGVSTWYGAWATSFESGVPCGDMTLSQSGDSITGSCAGGGSIVGTVNGTELTGTLKRNPGSPTEVTLTYKFFMSPDGTQFQGNFNTTFYWCGHRGGASLPSPCLKN